MGAVRPVLGASAGKLVGDDRGSRSTLHASRREAPVHVLICTLGPGYRHKQKQQPTGLRPRRIRSAKAPEDDGAAHASDAKHL